MATWQFEFYGVSEKSNVLTIDKKSLKIIEDVLKETESWSRDIIQYGDIDGDCVELIKEDDEVVDIQIRLDMRKSIDVVLESIICFMKHNELKVLYADRVYDASVCAVKGLANSSGAKKFLDDPIAFFKEIHENSDRFKEI